MTDDRRQKRRRADDLSIAGEMTEAERDSLADEIAERVADKAFRKFQLEVGRSVIRNLLLLLGLGGAAILAVWKHRGGDLP